MKEIKVIKSLYNPVQPTINPSDTQVIYRERTPGPPVQNLIYCYWQLKTSKPLAHPFTYRVVADGCMDVFFDITGPGKSFVMGFCKKYTEFPLKNSFHYVGIRFLPSMFPQIFQVNAKELTNRYEKLELVNTKFSRFIRQLVSDGSDFKTIAKRLDAYFINHLGNVPFDFDARFYRAVDIILRNSGAVKTGTDLNTGISSRQLRRIFNYYTGTTPKTFSKVVRFQNILNAKPSARSLEQSRIFYDAGFYDQPHFIKEFKNLYGATPGKAFQ